MTHRCWCVTLLVLAVIAAGCGDDGTTDPAAGPPTDTGASDEAVIEEEDPPAAYRADIRRTGPGVAHVTADDLASLAFGQGWAYAEDRVCTLLDQIVKVRGERSRFHGRGEGDVHLNSDFAYRHLGLYAAADERWADQPEDITEVVDGYVAGVNGHLEDVGADAVNGWCAGKEWVEPITTTDLYAYMSDLLLLASGRNLIGMIATAQPPDVPAVDDVEQLPPVEDPVQGEQDAEEQTDGAGTGTDEADEAALADLSALSPPPAASNGWAIGSEMSAEDGGLLLANPHFPWEGELRFWEVHLTVPDEIDVYGVALSGMPGVQLGFNEHIAWTHTVSAGRRFTVYSLDLVEDEPTRYVYGDEERDMESTEIEVEVLQEDGTLGTETRTMWSSHYGPMLELPMGWSAEQGFSYRDANAEITTTLSQFLAMDRAQSMEELQAAHEEHQGIPWVNTIATDAEGRAWFADAAPTPNLRDETIEEWRSAVEAGELAALVDANGATLLDGSNPDNEWVDDPDAPAPGLVPYAELPELERNDYVFNANDSHWLTNPDELLTGFSPMHGLEQRPVSARTRMNIRHLEEDAGEDGTFDLAEVQESIFSNRSLHAELLLDAMVEACQGAEGDLVQRACDTLAGWDGRYQLDARGAILWREWLNRFEPEDRTDSGVLYSDSFDPADPAHTPNTPVTDREAWLAALEQAAQALEDAGIPLDAPLGEFQFDGRTDERIPLHGGLHQDGIANVMGCCANSTSTGPSGDTGQLGDGLFRDVPGYPVTTGASFLMALAFTEEGPVAEAFLTYGQPDARDDPGFTSQTERFSDEDWRPILFRDEDIENDPDLTSYTVEVGQ
jgi:acyl-homoserine-lactone acylase